MPDPAPPARSVRAGSGPLPRPMSAIVRPLHRYALTIASPSGNGMIQIRHVRPLVASLLLSLLAGPVFAADIYRWVDDEGVVHYTENPPRERPYEAVQAAPPPADDPEQRQQQIEQLEREIEGTISGRRQQREQRAAERARAQERAARCEELRGMRNKLANSPQVRDSSEDYRVIPYEERQEKLEQFDRRIEEVCNGA